MKLLLFIFSILLSVNANRQKRGLSQEEEVKLIKELNIDRAKLFDKLNMTFELVEYNPALEDMIMDVKNCREYIKNPQNPRIIPLKLNSLSHHLYDNFRKGTEHDSRLPFFDPTVTQIGCSKSYQCFMKYDDHFNDPRLAGKILESRGGCTFGKTDFPKERIGEILLEAPSISKYGDLIGVVEPEDGDEEEEVDLDVYDKDILPGGSRATFLNMILSVVLAMYI